MKHTLLLLSFLVLFPAALSAGNLTVQIFSTASFSGAVPGESVEYYVTYMHQGSDNATNVKLTLALPKAIGSIAMEPTYTQKADSVYTFQLGTLAGVQTGSIMISGILGASATIGSTLKATAVISGTAANDLLPDNSSFTDIKVSGGGPDLWLFNFGQLEEMEAGDFLTAELNVQSTYEFTYMNFSSVAAQNVRLIDSLPAGLEYVSAAPAPSSTSGNILVWNIGTVDGYENGKISVVLKPTKTGLVYNPGTLVSSVDDANPDNNRSVFFFEVKTLLQPHVLRPSVPYGSEDTVILGANPAISGMAKAGATVSLYEGDAAGATGDLSLLHPKLLGSAVVGADRVWQIKTTTVTEPRVYNLYVRAELNGQTSSPLFNTWMPLRVRMEPMIALSGLDLDNFSVQTGSTVVKPGALGTTSGSVPDADIIIIKRLRAPQTLLTDTTLWYHHRMILRITEGGLTHDEDWTVDHTEQPPGQVPGDGWLFIDFVYKHKGKRAGAKMEILCYPIYYGSDGSDVMGLVPVKCHEILIDPAGYVYDKETAGSTVEWPNVPPSGSLINNATVTCTVRNGDNTFVKWNAAAVGQVNPQVTDVLTKDGVTTEGYFAFFVQSGQYQVKATAPDYIEYVSPVLTVVDEPVYHNVGMTRAAANTATSVKWPGSGTVVPSLIELDQNYPNPFNPTTTIGYYLPRAMTIRLTIYDVSGREVAVLINNETRAAGRHQLQLDATRMSSGMYFYRLSTETYSDTKKFVIVK